MGGRSGSGEALYEENWGRRKHYNKKEQLVYLFNFLFFLSSKHCQTISIKSSC